MLGKQKFSAKCYPPALFFLFKHSVGMCKSGHSRWRCRLHPSTNLCKLASPSHPHPQPKFLSQSTVFQSYPPSSSFGIKMKWGLFDFEKIPFKEKDLFSFAENDQNKMSPTRFFMRTEFFPKETIPQKCHNTYSLLKEQLLRGQMESKSTSFCWQQK